jgi:hypothetical protein
MRAIEVNRLAALLMCLTSLLTLGGCAPVVIRASSATHPGESGKWISSPQVASEDADRGEDGSNQRFRCPADDGLIGRLAVR